MMPHGTLSGDTVWFIGCASAGAVSFGGCLATQTIRPWRLGHLGWVRARHGGCHRQPAQFIKGN